MKSILALATTLALTSLAHADQDVTIRFAAEIGGKPFSCQQTYDGLGTTNATVRGTDYRLFVQSPALVRADGGLQPIALNQDGKWQVDDVALLDFEDGTGGCNGTGGADRNITLRGKVPEGQYTGLTFQVGVPFELNHGDPTLAAPPLNTTAMFWNWQNGYRFVRIDLVPTDRATDGPKGWFLHLGSTQCAAPSRTEAPSACANPNRMTVTFAEFDPARNEVVVDPAPVIAQADLLVNAPQTSPGCMSFPNDPDCMTVMTKLGLPYGDIPAGEQRLFTFR